MPTQPPKHDFEGEKKKKDTYDADWVFVRNKRPKGPNYSAGAWMTKRQRKELVGNQKEARAYRKGVRANTAGTPPAAAAPLATVPILTGNRPGTPPGPAGPYVPPTDPTKTALPGVPSWWINAAIQNPADPNQQFANVANALLPTLAPEDQRTLATYLATNFKDVYGGYANTNFGPAPTEITDAMRQQYLSPQRAQTALSLLDRMKAASGSQNMGAGYDFLRNAVGLINQFAGGGAMPRENYNQFTNAVSSLVGQAGKDMSAYANLAQLFNLPKFTAGPLVSNAPNTRLFS